MVNTTSFILFTSQHLDDLSQHLLIHKFQIRHHVTHAGYHSSHTFKQNVGLSKSIPSSLVDIFAQLVAFRKVWLEKIKKTRALVVHHNCTDCHRKNSLCHRQKSLFQQYSLHDENHSPLFSQVIQEHHIFFKFLELVDSTSNEFLIVIIHQNMTSQLLEHFSIQGRQDW